MWARLKVHTLSLSYIYIVPLPSLRRVARQAAASPPLGINNSAGDWLLPPRAGTFCSLAACWSREEEEEAGPQRRGCSDY